MRQMISVRKWILLLAAGGLLLVSSGEALAWGDDCFDGGRYDSYRHSRWHSRHHHHPAIYVNYSSYGTSCAPGSSYGYEARTVAFVQADTVVVNIPNSNGSYTPVTLRRENGFYVGPRGEYYATMPTVEQLKAVYGLQ